MRAATIAGVELRRFLRDRANIFFVFVFPLLLVLLIGAQFGEGAARGQVTVVGPDSALRADLVAALRDRDLDVELADRDAALAQVARARSDAAVLVEPGAVAAHAAGEPVELPVVRSSRLEAQAALEQVRAAADEVALRQGQLQALVQRGLTAEEASAALAAARGAVSVPTLRVESTDPLEREFEGLAQFDLGASGQLLLFVFITSLTGATTLIQARKLGVVRRVLAGPVTTTHVVAGQMLGRFAIAMFQGLYLMLATALLFGVDWGTTWVAVVVLAVFALVAAGVAMVIGAVFDNEGAASGVGVGAGLVLAALGGSMMPLELFPDTMRAVAHVTPHAWGYEALAEIQRRDGGLLDVLPQLGALAAMAATVLVVGAWALRRSLARAL